MITNEKFNQAIWWVLQEIKKENLSTRKDYYTCFEYQSPDNDSNNLIPSREDQKRILNLLKNKKVIKIEKNKYSDPLMIDFFAQMKNIKPIGCLLEILQPKFDELYKKFATKFKKEIEHSSNKKIEFLDSEIILKFGEKSCPLPAYRNEHFFCRAMFEYPAKEPIDWSQISEKMDIKAIETNGKKRSQRSIYDTTKAINKRTKEILGIDGLFVWSGKTIMRTR